MIQVVTYTGKEQKYEGAGVEQYSLHDIRSLDEYDINVIDLSAERLWVYRGTNTYAVDKRADLESISQMISYSQTTKVLLIFPQNVDFCYGYSGEKYSYKQEIKNMLSDVTASILSVLYPPIADMILKYENTKTQLGLDKYEAAFCFVNEKSDMILLKSEKSNKVTAIKRGKVVLTTLQLPDYSSLFSFFKETQLIKEKNEIPTWMNEICMFDDAEQNEVISHCNDIIKETENQIEVAQEVLASNDRLKSVLYTNGDELVEVVFDILEEMLGCDLSGFVDEKKEDFLFDLEGFIFIGEIKGVNHNVKNQNVTQLDVHYQGYLDEHEDADKDKLKALLIINHQKNKPLFDREPVKDTQIQLAERNGSLIVDTYTLLRLLEKCRQGSLSREEILNMLKKTIGYLVLD